MCDETSLVKPDDYIVTDFFDKEYRFENYDCDVKIDDYDPYDKIVAMLRLMIMIPKIRLVLMTFRQ